MYQTINLSHVDAQEMIDVVRRQLEADHKAAAIAVSDSHGELIAFLKMDGCRLPPIQIAMNKAFTAAREGRLSADLGRDSLTRPFPLTNLGDLRYTGFTGGAPVIIKGQVAGAIGISGIDDESEAELSARAVEMISKKAPR